MKRKEEEAADVTVEEASVTVVDDAEIAAAAT